MWNASEYPSVLLHGSSIENCFKTANQRRISIESMTDSSRTTQDFGMSAARNDVLSEVLTLIRLRGELVYTAFLGKPWGFQFQPGAAHFYFVKTGEAWVTPAGGKPTKVSQGELVLLPLGKGHTVTDGRSSSFEKIETVAAEHFDRD